MAYARVNETVWSDGKIRSLGEDARTMFLYLLTSPHRNRLGAFILRPGYAGEDLQWRPDRVEPALEELEGAGRISRDPETGLLLVHRHLHHNALENPNVVKGAIGELRALPDTPLLEPLLHIVEKEYRDHYAPLLEALRARVARLLGTTPPPTIPTTIPTTVGRTDAVTPWKGQRQQEREEEKEKEEEDGVENDAPTLELAPGALGRLEVWLEDPTAIEVARTLATDTGNPARWALAFLGAYGPTGTEERLLAALKSEKARRRAVATALLAYYGEGHEWSARLFRSFLATRIRDALALTGPIPGTESATVAARGEPHLRTMVRLPAREGGGLVPASDLLTPEILEA